MRDHGALVRLLDARARMPFAGLPEHAVCILVAALAVQTQTGRDPLRGLRRRLKTPLGSQRLLAELGGLRAAVTSRLGAEIPTATAARGDIVLIGEPWCAGEFLALVEGATLVAAGETGWTRYPRAAAVTAWNAEGSA